MRDPTVPPIVKEAPLVPTPARRLSGSRQRRRPIQPAFTPLDEQATDDRGGRSHGAGLPLGSSATSVTAVPSDTVAGDAATAGPATMTMLEAHSGGAA